MNISTALRMLLVFGLGLPCLVVNPSAHAHAPTPKHQILEVIKHLDTGEEERDLDHISQAKHYEFAEVGLALTERLDLEAQRIASRFTAAQIDETPEALLAALKPRVLFELIGALTRFANAELLVKIDHALAQLHPALVMSVAFDSQYQKFYYDLRTTATKRTQPLPSMAQLLASRTSTHLGLPAPDYVIQAMRGTTNSATAAYDQMFDCLSKRLTGQPEVVRALADLEFRNRVYAGKRTKPVHYWLMGQPGTGKDTTAEAYTDCINGGTVNAFEHEMFSVPVLRSEADLWKMFGSNTGYVGSDNFPPLLKYLVHHSGGRYQINERKGSTRTEYYVTERFAEGSEVLIDITSSTPEKAVVFLNEFQNWSKDARDAFKEMLEKGIFPINNPSGGLDQIRVPVTYFIGSNDALALVTSREMNGERFGPALTYEQSLAKWQAVHTNYVALRAELMRSNGAVNQRGSGGNHGYSEEFINRIPDHSLLLMRPLSPENLQTIAEHKLVTIAEKLTSSATGNSQFDLSWTPAVAEFVQQYRYLAEDNARPIGAKAENLIEQTLLDIIREGAIPRFGERLRMRLDVGKNPDRTTNLIVQVSAGEGVRVKTISRLIRATEADREKETMERERIEHLRKLSAFLQTRVFGLDDSIVDRLTRSILLAEEAKHGREDSDLPRDGAKILGFFGLSSSGKTETSSVMAEFLYGRREAKVTIDFSQIKDIDDMKHRILGTRDAHGNPIASEFMKQYDRSNGQNLLFVFDELANAPMWALKALYDIFREPTVTTFADSKPRPMNGISIILTGNAGEEWYRGIPRDVPEAVQMYAMHQVYARGNSNPHLRREVLETYFSEALINRIGERNIFFFAPAGFKSIRELSQLKLLQSIDALKPKEGRYGWQIQFASSEDYITVLDLIDENGFVVREQGASIDRFVKQEFESGLRHLLITKNIPVGTRVIVSRDRSRDREIQKHGRTYIETHLRLQPDGHNEIDFAIEGKDIVRYPTVRDDDRIITAAHEAGHAITQAILFELTSRPSMISIIPGVTNINNKWVYYAGIAESETSQETRPTREAILASMAVLAGGEVAESLVTKNRRTGAGKSNDMERATTLAINAIVRWGLSERWGTMSVPTGMTTLEFIKSLPEDRRRILYDEVDQMIKAARHLAFSTLAANMDNAVIPLAILVAEKGQIGGAGLESFFKSTKINGPVNGKFAIPASHTRWVTGQKSPASLEPELVDWMPRPARVATLEEIVARERSEQIGSVEVSPNAPIATGDQPRRKITVADLRPKRTAGCDDLLRPGGGASH